MERGQSVTRLVIAHKEDRIIIYTVFPWELRKKNVFCFIANPVTNMLWFIFKSILILLPCGGVFFLFDLCIKEMNFFFFNLDSCSNHSNDPNHSITPSSETEYLKLYPDFRNQLL